MRVFIRGDTHGDYTWLSEWCAENETTTEDILIILGDNTLRFEGANKPREQMRKELVSKQPITILAVRGNHDRPFRNGLEWDVELTKCPFVADSDPLMWYDNTYPNIWYFQDWGEYHICGRSFLIAGGAFSVDKEWRLLMHWTWYPEEQMTHEDWLNLFDWAHDRGFDFVLSHTCPFEWQPTDLFLKSIDQSKVDNTTERQLSYLASIISWHHWYFGHFHDNRDLAEDIHMLFDKVVRII